MASVIVVGLGVMGAAICRALARRGVTVTGIDALAVPHDRGSSHGPTRIIREAYFEHPLYVPLVQRAYNLWAELAEEARTPLFQRTGALMIGPPDGVVVRGAIASAQQHGLAHDVLTAAELSARYPACTPDHDISAVFEPNAGILFADSCVNALLAGARAAGAELRDGVRVTSWRVTPNGDVVLSTNAGELRADRVVFAAGPWLRSVVAAEASALELPLTVERQVTHHFAPAPDAPAFTADVCPVTLREYERDRFVYTVPDVGSGLKAALHHHGEAVQPDHVDRSVSAADTDVVRRLVEELLPGAAHAHVDSSVCLYTNTRDGHFLIDAHPAHEQVQLVSACSGHGFKFAPAIGEVVAELLVDGHSRHDISPFGINRETL